MARPYLLIDIDGVLNPLTRGTKPAGFKRHELAGYDVWLNQQHGAWLKALGTWFDLVWATTWEHEARLIATVLSLPLDMPVIEFDRDSQDETWKLNDVRHFVGDRPFAWIDDDLWSDALDWAEERSSPTLLVRVAPHRGLTQSHVERLEVFGRSLMGTTDRDPDDPG